MCILNIQYVVILTKTEFRILLRVPVAVLYRQLQNEWHSRSVSDLSRGIISRVGVIIVLKHRIPDG